MLDKLALVIPEQSGVIYNPIPAYPSVQELQLTVIASYTAIAIVIVVMLLIFIRRNLARPKELFYCLIVIIIGLVTTFYGTFLFGMFNFLYPSKTMCVQTMTTSCFLGTPICHTFPHPCNTPPLWFSQPNANTVVY